MSSDKKTIVEREIERSKKALEKIWGEEMAKHAVDYAATIAEPPQTDLILACGVGLLARYIEKLHAEINELKELCKAKQ